MYSFAKACTNIFSLITQNNADIVIDGMENGFTMQTAPRVDHGHVIVPQVTYVISEVKDGKN